VQYRALDLHGAIRTFERLVAEHPAEAALAETLARWQREAALNDRLRLEVGSRFTVAFEGASDTAVAAAALESLEAASVRIGDVLGVYPVTPVPVVLYTTSQFRDITRAPEWAGGAFDGIVRIPVRDALARRAEFDRVLTHEYIHALVRMLAPRNVPTWLDEGLAEALQHDPPRPPPAVTPLPLQALARGFGRLSRADAERAYATSGLAVRRLLDDAGGYAIANLLRDVGTGVPFPDAFAHRLQRSLRDFEASLREP
jgi:hypothetical protein